MALSNRLAAELLGTFWLVLGGCGSAALAGVAYRGIAGSQPRLAVRLQ